MYYGYYRWRRRRRAGPKKAEGGIKPDSKRGHIGQGWLAREWMEMLEEADPGGEFARGKTYARKGQVLSIMVEMGVVASRVQGSARHPYRTIIQFGLPGVNYWRKFAGMLREQPALAARVLAGEMPEEIGEELSRRGLSLFQPNQKIRISCNCDRWTAICKHTAAVCHIIAEELDRDPFLYMKIFGIERDELLEMMGSGPGEMRMRHPRGPVLLPLRTGRTGGPRGPDRRGRRPRRARPRDAAPPAVRPSRSADPPAARQGTAGGRRPTRRPPYGEARRPGFPGTPARGTAGSRPRFPGIRWRSGAARTIRISRTRPSRHPQTMRPCPSRWATSRCGAARRGSSRSWRGYTAGPRWKG